MCQFWCCQCRQLSGLFQCWALSYSVYSWETFPGFSLNPPFHLPCFICVLRVNHCEHNSAATHTDTACSLRWTCCHHSPGFLAQLCRGPQSWTCWSCHLAAPSHKPSWGQTVCAASNKQIAQAKGVGFVISYAEPDTRCCLLKLSPPALLCIMWIMLTPPVPGYVFPQRCVLSVFPASLPWISAWKCTQQLGGPPPTDSHAPPSFTCLLCQAASCQTFKAMQRVTQLVL